jgi:hypothetical protein
MKIGHGFNSGILEFRDLGIEGILSLLIYRFYPLIPQSPNSSIPQFGTNRHRWCPKKLTHFKSKFLYLD